MNKTSKEKKISPQSKKFVEELIVNNSNLPTKFTKNNSNLLNLSWKEYDELINVLSDELMAKGFDINYEPNSYGTKIERLIDELLEIMYEIED